MARVLVTGSAGAIGRIVCAELQARGHTVRGFDLEETPGVADAVRADLADFDAVRGAARGLDTIVHLGAVPNDAPFEVLVGPNVLGVHHVLETAREQGMRRVVLTSTIQVIGWLTREKSVKVTAADRAPVNRYALSKLWAEDMGSMYARVHGLSVVVPRVGWMVRNEAEAKRMIELRAYSMYLSPRDASRFYAAAVEAEGVDFAVMFVAGLESATRLDLEPARILVGWEPKDSFPEGLPFEVERPKEADERA